MEPFSIRTALLRETPPIRKKALARLEAFAHKLASSGMPSPRDDSRLLFAWATGRLPRHWDDEAVLAEIQLTHYLYNHTAFPQVGPLVLSTIEARMVEDEPKMPPLMARRVCHEFVAPALRAAIFERSGVPTPWPWLGKSLDASKSVVGSQVGDA